MVCFVALHLTKINTDLSLFSLFAHRGLALIFFAYPLSSLQINLHEWKVFKLQNMLDIFFKVTYKYQLNVDINLILF